MSLVGFVNDPNNNNNRQFTPEEIDKAFYDIVQFNKAYANEAKENVIMDYLTPEAVNRILKEIAPNSRVSASETLREAIVAILPPEAVDRILSEIAALNNREFVSEVLIREIAANLPPEAVNKILEEIAPNNRESASKAPTKAKEETARKETTQRGNRPNKPNQHKPAAKAKKNGPQNTRPRNRHSRNSGQRGKRQGPRGQRQSVNREGKPRSHQRPSSLRRISQSLRNANFKAREFAGNFMAKVRESGFFKKAGKILNSFSAFLTNTNPTGRLLEKLGKNGKNKHGLPAQLDNREVAERLSKIQEKDFPEDSTIQKLVAALDRNGNPSEALERSEKDRVMV